MKRCALILTTVLLVGCADSSKPQKPSATNGKSMETAAKAGGIASSGETTPLVPEQQPEPTAVPLEPGTAELVPANTKIEFVGAHVGEKPDPRLGGFEKFTGKVSVDDATKALTAVSFNIDTDSIWTQMGGKLTTHLKSPDFFDVKEFPEIKFQSMTVEPLDAATGTQTVTGDLTLHGITKPIKVPVTLSTTDAGKKLVAEFTIDRTEFGMTYGDGKVENMVSLTVVIGEKTEPKTAEAEPKS